MNIFAFHSKIKYSAKNDETVLTEHDFHPCSPFFIEHNIIPESIKNIRTKGIFETTRYIRHTLKIIDALLEINGELTIEFFRVSFDVGGYPLRPLNYLMNEISICYKERYIVVTKEYTDNIDYILLRKIEALLPVYDQIQKWSFGIVSDGRKNDRIINIIAQISNFNIPEYEILICGPTPIEELPENVIIIDDSDLYFDLRIPISKKKNRIIEQAKYNNLVIIHDRISFSKDWYKNMVRYGNYFDQLCIPILDEETHSLRVNDWLKNHHDFTLFHLSKSIRLKYTEWDRHIYSDGGFLLIKKHIIDKVKYNSFLNWGEMEDVDLSERLYLYGNSISFYPSTFVLSQTHRIKVYKETSKWFRFLFNPILNFRYQYALKKKIDKNFNNFLEQNN
jgi:hypothetical protein